MERTHALYRFYGTDGLLYIGITFDPGNRWRAHREDKPWWHEVRGITMETYPDRESVLAAEARAITIENPRYNVQRPKSAGSSRKAPRPQIVWPCRVCDQAISNGDGYLEVDMGRVHVVEAAHREYEERRRGRSSWTPIPVAELLDLPSPAQWRSYHRRCDPNPDAYSYWIDIARVRTQGHLLDWTAHLMGKVWLEHTNWSDVLRRHAGVDA